MLGRKAYRFVACGAAAVFGIAFASLQLPTNAQQPAGTGPYTAEQANAGRATYQIKCATCHLPDLKGSNEASPLTGINFLNTWRDRTTSDLFNRIRNTMPVTDPGSLGDEEAVNIVAYIFQANGAAAFQSVGHFHMHLIPRWTGDGKGFDWKVVPGNREDIMSVADRIRTIFA